MRKFLLALPLLMSAVPSFAEPCDRFIRGVFDGFSGDVHGPGHWHYVKGSRITSRGYGSFTSHAMHTNYRNDMTQAEKSRLEGFTIAPTSNGMAREGKFLDVFPGRQDGANDLTTLRIQRDGRVQIVLNSWGNASTFLTDLSCYPAHRGSGFVLTGFDKSAGYGTTIWNFHLAPGWLL